MSETTLAMLDELREQIPLMRAQANDDSDHEATREMLGLCANLLETLIDSHEELQLDFARLMWLCERKRMAMEFIFPGGMTIADEETIRMARRARETEPESAKLTGWPRSVAAPGLPQTRTCAH